MSLKAAAAAFCAIESSGKELKLSLTMRMVSIFSALESTYEARSPARAWLLDNVRTITRLSNSASSVSAVRGEKAAYASSSMRMPSMLFAILRIVSSDSRMPVGAFGLAMTAPFAPANASASREKSSLSGTISVSRPYSFAQTG